MNNQPFPAIINNWISGREVPAASGKTFENLNPANGAVLCRAARSAATDVEKAVADARRAQPAWAAMPVVQRGMVLHEIVLGLRKNKEAVARMVALETGKSMKASLGEVDGAAALGLFYASEGQRFYGKTTTSGAPNKYAMTIRQPMGVAGLIIAANTPIANVAWKVFPALLCGNSAVLKASEDAPGTSWIFGKIALEAGLPSGVLNVIQGLGQEAGAPLVEHADVDVVSFTGSTKVGREIAATMGKRMGKASMELGGKNPLVVCDDADLDNAVKWAALSAFSNAGQRCASGSRLIIFESVYDEFKMKLLATTAKLRLGVGDDDDLGPVINERQLNNMLAAIEQARKEGAVVLCGGKRAQTEGLQNGFYLEPTIIENADPAAEISVSELFGPITSLYRVRDFKQALDLANNSPYGLTACIHTASVNRMMEFTHQVQAGVAVVNAGTFGSEPHMPFGGVKQSGNGFREPGTEALDVYSELKDIYIIVNPDKV
jgi:aldehyde dehydrogenase (NAD+)